MDAQMRTIQKKRTANFREDETKLLIQLWGNPLIQNKLFLTHRKAPVMRILAANMQQRGFYRTPDEIKTRIRNLKCLYHRIKRTMSCGTGIGTVDPDWPHFKSMDAILSKQEKKKDPLAETVLEGPKCEDIKQEIDIEFNDDIESWATNDSVGSDYEEHPTPPPLHIAPTISVKSNDQLKFCTTISESHNKNLPTIVPSFALPSQSIQTTQTTANGIRTGTVPSIPVPLLILNSLQPQQTQEKKDGGFNFSSQDKMSNDLHSVLKDLVNVQKESLEVERQRLTVEKQRLEFDRLIGTQLITLIPMIGGFVQRLTCTTRTEDSPDTSQSKCGKKRPNLEQIDIYKGSKLLRTMLEQGIKQYMLSDLQNEKDSSSSSDNEDSIQNDENSNATTKD